MLQANLFSKIKWLIFFQLITLSAYAGGGPCLTITCPANINVSNDNGSCSAVVNYTAPIVSNSCLPPPPLAFGYTGSVQTFTVPAGVSSISIEAWGAQGQDGTGGLVGTGGLGGYASGTLSVTPGQVLNIYVGGRNGYNGGGAPGVSGTNTSGYGGGATDIRVGGTALTDRVLVAGGGGGGTGGPQGSCAGGPGGSGGNGGGTDGNTGSTGSGCSPGGTGGTGGTQVDGGTGGTGNLNCNATAGSGLSGSLGTGGIGGDGIFCTTYTGSGGGGGGGGYYGGAGGGGGAGGAGGAWSGGGGGGGSSYIGGVANGTSNAGVQTGDGMVALTFNYDLTVTQLSGLPSGSNFPLGTTTNTYTVTYGGNSSLCSFTVTVNDTTAPVITCTNDTTVSTDNGNCGALIIYDTPLATELCQVISEANFNYTGNFQGFVVPAGITSITMFAAGAEGGGLNGLGGDGATLQGDFIVSPGDSIVILAGGKGMDGYYGDGGGGGSFVYNYTTGSLMLAAGGGGGAGTECGGAPGNPGLITSDGGSVPGATGGSAGQGGQGNPFAAGGGAGGLTNGGDGAPDGGGGGQSPLAGGAGGIGVTGQFWSGDGGFGGGGAGGNRGGGGGGGYSGGAGASNGGGCGEGGGGGGSFNGGTNQDNYEGANTGNGYVIFYWINPITITQTAGLPSGSVFPIGTTVNSFTATTYAGNSSSCSFTVTVEDNEDPVATCPSNITTTCNNAVNFLATAIDNCIISTIDVSDTSGTVFPVGTTTVTVTATDVAGNTGTCTFDVEVTEPIVTLTLPADTLCNTDGALVLSGGTPSGGTYSGTGVSGGSFDPATATLGTNTITYTYDDNGCVVSATDDVEVEICPGIEGLNGGTISLYPNPATNYATLKIDGMAGLLHIEVIDVLGQSVKTITGNVVDNNHTQRMDVSNLSPAIYLVKVKVGESSTLFTMKVQ